MGAFITPSDVEIALGAARYIAVFDDNNDGVVDPAVVEQVIMRAEARVGRYAREAFGLAWPPSPVPDEVKVAAIDYAIVLGEARVGHLTRADLDERLEALDQDMKDVAKGLTSLTAAQVSGRPALADVTPSPPGALSATSVNFDDRGRCEHELEWWRKEGCG